MSEDDFFVEDEPLAQVMDAFLSGRKAVTQRPLTSREWDTVNEILRDNPWSGFDLPALRPGVTVCIPYHTARLHNGMLTRALSSVAAQTQVPEVVRLLHDSEGKGAGWARRSLLSLVDTEWVAWLDSDDEWLPEHLEKLMRVALATDSAFVYSWFHGNDPLGHFGLPFNPCTPHHTTMGILERTDIAQEISFPDSAEGGFSNEDWAHITGFAQIACERGLKMTHLAEKTWIYHQQGQNTSGQPGQGDNR